MKTTSSDVTDAAFVRLSDSPIWDRQRAYFEAQGPRAWANGDVPHYVTCNPVMARAFAEVIAGFAADCARGREADVVDRTLYVVELGAGSGRLGWNIVRALRGAVDAAALAWRIVYVLTDLAEDTVAWWLQHPRLAPLIAAGLVDVARFDATADDHLALRASGQVISVEEPAEPLVVIANYVFDSLPHDVFASDAGRLDECLVAAEVPSLDPARGFTDLALRWRREPLAGPRFADPVHQQILEAHGAGEGIFAFPTDALVALDRLRTLASGPLLVLSADKGATRLDQVMTDATPAFATHGSLSMDVNYLALGAWAVAHGGAWLHNEHHHRALEVCALVLGEQPHAATLAAFERAIAQRGPDDFYALKRLLVERAAELTAGEVTSYLRLSGHDPKLFVDLADPLRRAARRATGGEREDLARVIARVWDGYFPIGEGDAVARLVAELGRRVGQPPEATPAPVEDPFALMTGAA